MRSLVLPPLPEVPSDEDAEEFCISTLRVNAEAIYGRGIVTSFVRQMTADLQLYGRAAERALDLRTVDVRPGQPDPMSYAHLGRVFRLN